MKIFEAKNLINEKYNRNIESKDIQKFLEKNMGVKKTHSSNLEANELKTVMEHFTPSVKKTSETPAANKPRVASHSSEMGKELTSRPKEVEAGQGPLKPSSQRPDGPRQARPQGGPRGQMPGQNQGQSQGQSAGRPGGQRPDGSRPQGGPRGQMPGQNQGQSQGQSAGRPGGQRPDGPRQSRPGYQGGTRQGQGYQDNQRTPGQNRYGSDQRQGQGQRPDGPRQPRPQGDYRGQGQYQSSANRPQGTARPDYQGRQQDSLVAHNNKMVGGRDQDTREALVKVKAIKIIKEHQVRTGMVQIRGRDRVRVKDQLVIDQEDIILLDLLAIKE